MPGSQKGAVQQQASSSSEATPPATATSSGNISNSSSTVPALAAAGSKSLAAVGEFKVEAARALLEAEIKDTFLGTAGAAAGEIPCVSTLSDPYRSWHAQAFFRALQQQT